MAETMEQTSTTMEPADTTDQFELAAKALAPRERPLYLMTRSMLEVARPAFARMAKDPDINLRAIAENVLLKLKDAESKSPHTKIMVEFRLTPAIAEYLEPHTADLNQLTNPQPQEKRRPGNPHTARKDPSAPPIKRRVSHPRVPGS